MRHSFQSVFLMVFISLFRVSFAAFGDDISQDNEDNRFADMGQVTKNTFDIVDGNVKLIFDVQDTQNVDELWILDFEPYRYTVDDLPIDEFTGTLHLENTGECSSVYETVNWTFFQDSYFKNRSAADLSAKSLFTSFIVGDSYDANGRRTDQIIYEGTIANFFECKKSDGITDVWTQTSNSSYDEIEYRTKVYATNVRPKDPDDKTAGVSFVQSHIVLIWRLSRQAIANFIISSTAILRPVIDFARVSAVYDAEGEPIPIQTRLHLRFTTIIDSDEQIAVYNATGTGFTPENPLHGLRQIIYEPPSTLNDVPDCDKQLDVGTGLQWQCHQTWNFIFILDIDTTKQTQNNIPIDASGTFDFLFDVYSCSLTQNELDKTDCVLVDPEPTKISTLITIQTTVFVRDEEDDQVTIILISLTGANNDELNVPGARGVAHKEDVSLKVKFSPALLRPDYYLELMLFMVCKGEQYAGDDFLQGCLEAPTDQRYVAHQDPQFTYSVTANDTGELVTYTTQNLTNDFVQALTSETYVETDDEGAELAVPYHESTFRNVALSAESSNYTITNVYKLTAKSKRRKRLAQDEYIVARHSVRAGRISAPRISSITSLDRLRRDLEDSVADVHGTRVAYGSIGCPEGAKHDADVFDCICPVNTTYSLRSFQCEIPYVDIAIGKDGDNFDIEGDLGSNSDTVKYSIYLSFVTVFFFMGVTQNI